jgi:hypothetical protein
MYEGEAGLAGLAGLAGFRGLRGVGKTVVGAAVTGDAAGTAVVGNMVDMEV